MEIKNRNSLPKIADDCGDNPMARSSSKSEIEKLETFPNTVDDPTQEVESGNKTNIDDSVKLIKKPNIMRIRYRKMNTDSKQVSSSEFKENQIDNARRNDSESKTWIKCDRKDSKIDLEDNSLPSYKVSISESNSSIDENDDTVEKQIHKPIKKMLNQLETSFSMTNLPEEKLENSDIIRLEEKPLDIKSEVHLSQVLKTCSTPSLNDETEAVNAEEEKPSVTNSILSVKNQNCDTHRSRRYHELRDLIASKVDKSKINHSSSDNTRQVSPHHSSEVFKSPDILTTTPSAQENNVFLTDDKVNVPRLPENRSQMTHDEIDSWILRHKNQQDESCSASEGKSLPYSISSNKNSTPSPLMKISSFEDDYNNNIFNNTFRRFSLDGKLQKKRISIHSEKFGVYLQKISDDVVNELKEKLEFDKKSLKTQITNCENFSVEKKDEDMSRKEEEREEENIKSNKEEFKEESIKNNKDKLAEENIKSNKEEREEESIMSNKEEREAKRTKSNEDIWKEENVKSNNNELVEENIKSNKEESKEDSIKINKVNLIEESINSNKEEFKEESVKSNKNEWAEERLKSNREKWKEENIKSNKEERRGEIIARKKQEIIRSSLNFHEKARAKTLTFNANTIPTHKSLKTYFENLSSHTTDPKDGKNETILDSQIDTVEKSIEKSSENNSPIVIEKSKPAEKNNEPNFNDEVDNKIKKPLQSKEVVPKIREKPPSSHHWKTDFLLLKNQKEVSHNKFPTNESSSKSDFHLHKFLDLKINSLFFQNEKLILPTCDPRGDATKPLYPVVSIKVTDLLFRRKTDPKDELPWALDNEEQNLVKRQPYLLKRLNRFNNCHINNDHVDPISNGFANKTSTGDRSSKTITFAETPQYFKLNMIDEVPENETPTIKSIEQARIKLSDKYFDQVALNLCSKKIVSFETLLFQLIHENPNVKTDLDKARAVFTWLTSKNSNEAHFEYINERKDYKQDETESPDVYLHGLCTGQYTYAQFFQLLCRYAGIRCKLLRGYAKGNDFKPGMKLEGGKAAQHAWNSVEINGIWYLCDTHWTARRLAGRNTNQGKLNSTKLDMFYFLIHPEDMKYSHFPFEPSWQLVANPISLETFEKLAIVKPAFFRFDLSFHNHLEAIIKTKNDIKIELKFPSNAKSEKLTFTYTLQMDGQLTDMHKDITLSRYGIVEIVNIEENMSLVRFWIRFPESGSYKIMIFAKSVEDQLFSGVCEYYVTAEIDATQEQLIKPFPPTQQTCYGKTELLSKYDITSSWMNDSIISLDGCIFEIKFQTRKKSDCSSCPRLMARLKCNSIEDTELSKKLLIRIMAPTEESYKTDSITTEHVYIRGYIPKNDEYALEIYANNPDSEGSSFFLIWQHLIVCNNVLLDNSLPHLSQGFILGAQERFKELGLRAISNPDPLIIVDKETVFPDSDVCIKLALPIIKTMTPTKDNKPAIRILGQLLDASPNNAEEENDYANLLLQQAYTGENNSLNEVEFLIRLNHKSNFYKLYIYAMSLDNELDTVPLAMTYLIQLNPKVPHDCLKGIKYGEFPQQTSQWKEDCRLIRPKNRVLRLPHSGSEDVREEFEVIIPHAMKVASVINEEWVQLTESENDKNTWTGSVPLSCSLKSGTSLTIFANFNSRYNSYIPLLEYVLQR